MRLLAIEFARPGMVLAKSALSAGGGLLLQAGMELSERFIERLQQMGLAWIYVEEALTDDIRVDDLIDEPTALAAAQSIRGAFDLVSSQKAGECKLSGAHAKRLAEIIEEVVRSISASPAISTSLVGLKALDQYIYLHAVSVAGLAAMLGIDQHLGARQLHNLGVGAILHDIGVVRISQDQLRARQEGRSEEAEVEYRKHARQGFEMVNDMVEVAPTSANVVLCHHEQWDGGGYPTGITRDQIHIFSRIVAVANVYDSLTSDKPWRKAVMPHVAVAYVRSQQGRMFDPSVVDSFVRRIAPYPKGVKVRLSDGTVGVVVELNEDAMARPLIRLTESSDGRRFPREIDLNLLDYPTLAIKDVVLH